MSGGYAWKVAQGDLIPKAKVVYHWREFWLGLRHKPWATNRKLMTAAWEGGKSWWGIKDRWGPENAISAGELALELSIAPRRARATVRALRKDGYPICTVLSPRGSYFRPRTLEEYRYWRNRTLWRRAADIIDTCGAQEMDEAKWFPQDNPVRPSLEWEKEDVETEGAPATALD